MLLTLRNDHKEHLSLLTKQTPQVIVDFCKLAIDNLQNGPNEKLYNTAAKKLEVEFEHIQNAVQGLLFLMLESCRHKLSDADFRDSVLLIGFNEEQQAILSKFYDTKKDEISKLLSNLSLRTWHYHDLEWRLEIQLATRSVLDQITPLVTLDLTLQDRPNLSNTSTDGEKKKITLQTDPTNLVHLTEVLEQALNEVRGQQFRRVQRTFK